MENQGILIRLFLHLMTRLSFGEGRSTFASLMVIEICCKSISFGSSGHQLQKEKFNFRQPAFVRYLIVTIPFKVN